MVPDTPFTRCLSSLFSQAFAYVLVGLLSFTGRQEVSAVPFPLSTEHSKSPLTQLQKLQSQGSQYSSGPDTLLQLADLYLEVGREV